MEGILEEKKKLTIIYFLMVISIILNIFVIPNVLPTYTNILNVIIWCVIFLLARKVSNQHNRFKGHKDKMKTTFIIVFIYLIGYYLSGLYFGYKKSIYSHSIIHLISNFVFYILVIMLQEYTRSRLVNNTRSSLVYCIITAMFIALSFNYAIVYSNFASGELGFKFIASQIYPTIIKGVLCSFLVRLGSYELSLMFLLPIKILEYIAPVVPDLDWFIIVAFDSALVILVYYYIYYEHMINIERFTRKEIKAGNPKSTIVSVVFVIAFTFFVAGFFPVQPVALMSNSMKPYIKRGDVVLVKKLKKEDLKNLCIGDVIEYSVKNNTVVHRIISITKASNGELEFITKGDANSTPDAFPVKEDQIIGITKHYIPYIGYPSVIFSEKILHMEDEFLYEGE